MAALTTQQVQVTGTSATYEPAGGSGDTIEARDGMVLHVKNGAASSVTVTVAVPGTEYGQPRADVGVAIPAGEDRFIQIPPELADPSDGRVHVGYSAAASVTIAALRS